MKLEEEIERLEQEIVDTVWDGQWPELGIAPSEYSYNPELYSNVSEAHRRRLVKAQDLSKRVGELMAELGEARFSELNHIDTSQTEK